MVYDKVIDFIAPMKSINSDGRYSTIQIEFIEPGRLEIAIRIMWSEGRCEKSANKSLRFFS